MSALCGRRTPIFLFLRGGTGTTLEQMSKNQKAGARHNRKDQTQLQLVHDAAVTLGAVCDEDEATDEGKSATGGYVTNGLYRAGESSDGYMLSKSIVDEIEKQDDLIFDGGAVKALGNGKVGGYLVRYSGEEDTDLEGEFFTDATDFGEATKLPVLYHHGLDSKIGRRRIGTGEVRRDDEGVWLEAQLNMRDGYEKLIYELAEKGKLGWSSGAAAHTVERTKTNKATHITQWYIAEASLTPTPAEPRNTAVSLKSLEALQTNDPEAEAKETTTVVSPQATVTASDATTVVISLEGAQTPQENQDMDEIKTVLDAALKPLQEQIAAQAEELKAVTTALKAEPVAGKASNIQVIEAAEDRPFKSLAENLIAIKDFDTSHGRNEAPRLKGLKAIVGAGESIASDGGSLLEPSLTSEFLMPIHETGPFSAGVSTRPVGTNSNSGWIDGVDETSRATGSRYGGIRGYRVAEGDAFTASKPAFRQIQWKLKKYGVLVYGTDELLADAAQFAAVVNQGAREELAFMVNDDIMNGLGVSGALGFMNSGALIAVSRTSGSLVLHDDIVNMFARLTPSSKSRSVWYVHPEVTPQLDKLYFTGSTNVLSPYVGYTASGARTLYGRPVVETEFNAALNTTGDIVLADMSQYLFWEKGGVQEAASIHVQFLTDQTVFRFIYRCDGQTLHASALTPYKGTTTTSPFVVLGSAT
jgi:HK97 family phage major capsid protein